MTRRSKREIGRALDGFDDRGVDDAIEVVWRDERTGELVDNNGDPADPDPDASLTVEINETLVMSRERAEEEGREILGPADVPQGDAIRVPGRSL